MDNCKIRYEFKFFCCLLGLLLSANFSYSQVPGDASADLRFWVKADAGVEEATADAAENDDAVVYPDIKN